MSITTSTAPTEPNLLLGIEMPKPKIKMYPVDQLPPNEDLPSDPPSREMIATAREYGIFQSIVIIDGEPPTVQAGRRRIKTARAAGLKTIPATVFPKGTTNIDVIALVENHQRSHNAKSDLHTIASLLQQGHSKAHVCEAAGISMATLEKRLVLLGLIPELRTAWEQNLMYDSVAEAAARLPKTHQQQLLPTLEKNGKISGSDVSALRRASITQAISLLPDEVFGTPAAQVVIDNRPWEKQVTDLLEQAEKLIPHERGNKVASRTRKYVLDAINEIDEALNGDES